MAYKGQYRTKSGDAYFNFRYEGQSDGTVRTYIEGQPSYGSRPDDGHSTHRYDAATQPHICHGEHPPTTLDDAIKYSKSWAERTERYIKTGKEINE